MKLSKSIRRTSLIGWDSLTDELKDAWAEHAERLESENEELKSRLDEYIENKRARMEEVDRGS